MLLSILLRSIFFQPSHITSLPLHLLHIHNRINIFSFSLSSSIDNVFNRQISVLIFFASFSIRETGDFILVNKFDYGVRLPIVNKKVIDIGEPKRGDVIVFRYPPQLTISYIKRVIGLPGVNMVYDHGQLIINGQKIPKVPTQFSREKDALDTPTSIYHKETIGDHTFTMRELEGVNVARQAPFINYVDNGKYANQDGLYWEVTVPKGHYFAMGDNRDQSADSRFWGFVPEENLTGRAFYVWMHKEPGFHLPSFNRNGKID